MKDARRSIVPVVQSLYELSNPFCEQCMDQWEIEVLLSWRGSPGLFIYYLALPMPGFFARIKPAGRHVVMVIFVVDLLSPP
jgi:hypothetical protein